MFIKIRNHTMLLWIACLVTTVNTNIFAAEETENGTVAEGNNKFAFDLYSQVKQDDGNLFLSPFSISTALAMTYAGARGNTATQMSNTLHFTLDQEGLHPAFSTLMHDLRADAEKSGFELSIANALWGQEGYTFHKEFTDITKNYYQAGFKEVDFIKNTESARQTINGWVKEQTKDKIKELIKPDILSEDTRLVLTNAIYFKGKWVSPFKKEYTKPEPFELITGEQVDVPMMSQTKMLNYFENEKVQVLEIPYKEYRLSMVIFLPKEKGGIKELENVFMEDFRSWSLSQQSQEVIVLLPKFKMTSEFSLGEALKSLGMTDAFDIKLADFSGITQDPKGLFISAVIHKAFADVNEEGTEAAAATAVIEVVGMGAPQHLPKPVFHADHPFIFIIRDMRSGSILFMGRVMDPRS